NQDDRTQYEDFFHVCAPLPFTKESSAGTVSVFPGTEPVSCNSSFISRCRDMHQIVASVII
ncbi:MAG TPA: hypothetical protein PKK43_17750, partial [Spirochaetota bacterium]|nr:hypothetical protein [Spirochaetota bacterium]